MPLLSLITFAAIVVFSWISHHPISSWESGVLIFAPIGVTIGALLLIATALKRATHKMPLLIRPILAVPVFIFLALIPYNIAMFLPAVLSPLEPKLDWLPWIVANTAVLTTLFLLIITLSVVLLVLYTTGQLVLRMLSIREEAETALFRFTTAAALGTMVWAMLSLFLGISGIWTAPVILSLALGSLISGWASIKQFLQTALRPLSILYRAAEFWSIGILGLAFGLMAVESIRPVPTGFDDMTYYANRVHHMIERQALVPGGPAFPFEALQSSLGIALGTDLMTYPLSLNLLFAALGLLAIYGFGRDFIGHRVGIVAAALWGTLPMTAALTVKEVKPDILLFFITTMAVWSGIGWFSARHETYRLAIAAALFGFALSVKLTAVFLFAPFVALIGIVLWQRQLPYVRIGQMIIALMCVLLPLLPWIGYGAASYRGSWPGSITTITYSAPSSASIQDQMWAATMIDSNSCSSTGAAEDQSSYARSGNALISLFTLPWDLTLNNRAGTLVAEVGLLFLTLLPALILWRNTVAQTTWTPAGIPRRNVLLIMAVSYFVGWLLIGKGMPWYGFAGLLFPLILIATLLIHAWEDHRITVVLWVIAATAVILGLSMHLRHHYNDQARLWYAGDLITDQRFIQMTFPEFEPAAEIVNTSDDGLILATATKFTYFIKDNDTRVVYDGLLDMFSCLDTGNEDAKTLERLRAGNISYIYFSKYLTRFVDSPAHPTLSRKISRFQEFAAKNLSPQHEGADHILYTVPKSE